jgi:hypothetical protein
LNWRNSQVEIACLEAPLVAGCHCLASWILDGVDGQ